LLTRIRLNQSITRDQISCIAELTDSERSDIKALIVEVERKNVKPMKTSGGLHKFMKPGVISRLLQMDEAAKGRVSSPRTVSWFNIPYFLLKKYSSAAHSANSFPIQTLMQANYSQHLMARDMQQAVCQMNDAPSEHCFHIAQLWCIVLENSLLVTCGTMSEESLCSDLINIETVPPKDMSSDSGYARIMVAYKGSVLWAIPLRECLSWFVSC